MQQQEYDLVIVGGGLVGASLALALQPLAKKLDWKICLVENQPPTNAPQISDWQPSFDARSTALAWGTRLIYERLGLWQDLEEHANPIEHIQITDRGFLGATQLHNTEQQVAALGYVVPNIWLGKVLWQGLAAAKNTQVLAPAVIHSVSFPNPEQALLEGELEGKPLALKAKLVVLADGGRSGIKQQLGIADAIHDYEQTAIIANVRMSKPHQGWAYERFAADGPMALLPLAGRDMALVWTRTNEQAATDAVLGDAEFLQAIQKSFGNRAGRFQKVGERFAYPLKKVRSKEQVRRNLVLLGNTAHYLHPVAGQGYNLAIRGVMSLAEALAAGAQEAASQGRNFHPGELPLLEKWQAQRSNDQNNVIGFSHGLIALFANDTPLLGHARAAGLIGLNLTAPLRRWITAKAMGV